MVTLYGKPGCGQCIASERMLKKEGVEYAKVDITQDPEAYSHVQELGYSQVPVLETEDEHWYGFKADKIKSLAL